MKTSEKASANFVVPLEELLEAGSHFGHQSKRWNPKMKEYLYTVRGGVHIFDLVKTAEKLKEAGDYLRDLAAKGGSIVFVGTKRQAQEIIKEEAQKAGAYFIAERWLGGIITNWEEISKRLRHLEETKVKKEAGEFKKYTKKENVLIDREIVKLTRFLGGLTGLKAVPDAIVVVDVTREIAAVREAKLRGVTVVAIVDSNADPDFADYVIPANDDAVRSIKLVVAALAKAVAEGKAMGEKKGKRSTEGTESIRSKKNIINHKS
ncbi:MAG: 30S ribosomal protein S2 [Candidatus Chisholmbacteria bacterium]|nr:30S ribosomal protein S2 [Candidatus Chisholmbacteria bacterium]